MNNVESGNSLAVNYEEKETESGLTNDFNLLRWPFMNQPAHRPVSVPVAPTTLSLAHTFLNFYYCDFILTWDDDIAQFK